MTASPAEPGTHVAVVDIDWSLWTVVLLKPDCLARDLTGPVLAMVGQHVRVMARRTLYPTPGQIFDHYADLLPRSAEFGVDCAAELRRIYIGHPVTVALGYGPDAARRLRVALGPSDPAEADPSTIRGRFGIDSLGYARSQGRLIDNVIHSSDHAGAVADDLARWFGPAAVALARPPADSGAA